MMGESKREVGTQEKKGKGRDERAEGEAGGRRRQRTVGKEGESTDKKKKSAQPEE